MTLKTVLNSEPFFLTRNHHPHSPLSTPHSLLTTHHSLPLPTMKHLSIILLLLLHLQINAQDKISAYFESIRKNEAQLTAFFAGMPKGGDLHHHFSGSAWPDYLLAKAIKEDYWVELNSYTVATAAGKTGDWKKFSEVSDLNALKTAILQQWSVKNYHPASGPSENIFFDSFGKFDAIMDASVPEALLELKRRAKAENLNYLETQFIRPKFPLKITGNDSLNNRLRQAGAQKDTNYIFSVFDELIRRFDTGGAADTAIAFNERIHNQHQRLQLDDDSFTLRYQNFVLRFMEPVELFKHLYVNFVSADKSPLIVGVNIVSPEHGDVSMQDYWLHMAMYNYLHRKFPAVKYAMHAGELTSGLVAPEELTWHINEAVRFAAAHRIGHGVDMAWEKNSRSLLAYMKQQQVAVEINLSSNEFILGVKENQHPISLYYTAGVPITISTDDAGILRTSITQQYILLAKRYPFISYRAIKEMVYNSIRYSFIGDEKEKKALIKNLDQRFADFEKTYSK
jgi:adenosine deaminase